ncbi:MAG: hypothetical protein AAFO04_17380 [Cyanobacteria bacterium J06592_8]
MLKFSQVLLSLILATSVQAASPTSASPTSASPTPEKFHQIQQPVPIKIAVTTAGLGLMGLEIWWFMFSKSKAKKASPNQGIQELNSRSIQKQ